MNNQDQASTPPSNPSGGSGFDHRPVMVDEIVDVFSVVPAGVIVDATVGGAGHAAAILASRDDLSVIGIDRDGAALEAAQQRLNGYAERAKTYRGRFDEVGEAMRSNDVTALSGALFDLGVSSPQLDRPERGFSYRQDGPLDMRMDTDQTWSADDVVNGYDETTLAEVISTLGDERFANRIASAIVAARPIESTRELADVVTAAIPAAARRTGGHPAKRTFQAIRIAVNDELDVLPGALQETIERLQTGGRVAVLSYHSGEDRIVKSTFRRASNGGCECPDSLPCVCDAIATVRLIRVPKQPTASEREENPRARSARLRVAEKIEPTPTRATPISSGSER